MRFSPATKPKDIATRLGISAKAASARMRRFKAKLADLYVSLTPGLRHHADSN